MAVGGEKQPKPKDVSRSGADSEELSSTRAEEGSMEWVYRDGHRTKVPSVDRGRMLVHSEDEWRLRIKGQKNRLAVFSFIILMVYTFMMIVLIWEMPILFIFVLLIEGIVSYVACSIFVNWCIWTGGPLPGIYERGIELRYLGSGHRGTFLPFSEIGGTSWWRNVAQSNLMLHLRHSPKRVTLQSGLYGVDGLRFVDDVIHGRAGLTTSLPRLVVYGPRGGG